MWRRAVVAALVLLAAAATFTPTYGITSVTADRSIDGRTAPDPEAYLGVVTEPVVVENNTTDAVLVRLTNRFDEPLRLAVEIDDVDGSVTVTALDAPRRVGPGESGVITADVACDSNGGRPAITVIARGETVRIELSRRVRVQCS